MSDDNKGDKLNLDLIQMVQKARMMHDSEAKPSEMAAVYWIEAKAPNATAPTSRAGEWVIETDVAEVDALWEKVKTATEAGQLGYKSKVSTASRSPQKGAGHRVIVVRTYDADDMADVERVKRALAALGFEDKIRYTRIKEE
jgi:hypothetical protein